MSSNDPLAVNVRDAAVQHSGTEFLDARHARKEELQHAGTASPLIGRLTEGTPTIPGHRGFAEIEAGRPRLEGDTPVKRPFGTGGMIRASIKPWRAWFQRGFHPAQQHSTLSDTWLRENASAYAVVGQRA